jgi:phospholipid N-methyltransferase
LSNTAADYLHFLWAGLVNHRQTGGIMPSQRFLIARMIGQVPEDYAGQLIELGAGCGALTLRLAARCPGATIVACEINPNLARLHRRNLAAAGVAGRVELFAGPAERLLSELGGNGTAGPDFVISGIPLGNLGRPKALAMIGAIHRALGEGGVYVQFQHSLLDRARIKAVFRNVHTVPVLLNFPPAVVYHARKLEPTGIPGGDPIGALATAGEVAG